MIDIVNGLISATGVVIQALLLLLPTSPFNYTYTIDSKFIQFMNYVLPFSSVVAHLTAYLTAVTLYYTIRVVLRWAKLAGN